MLETWNFHQTQTRPRQDQNQKKNLVRLELVQVLYGSTWNLTLTYTCARDLKFSPAPDQTTTRPKPEKNFLFDFNLKLRTYKLNPPRTWTCYWIESYFWTSNVIFGLEWDNLDFKKEKMEHVPSFGNPFPHPATHFWNFRFEIYFYRFLVFGIWSRF